jgi:hypothetical protein
MRTVVALFLGFLLTGSYLFFWPVYRILHPRKSQRRRALFRLFLLEIVIYISLTISLVLAVYTLPDFHQGGFLLAEITYLLLVVVFWGATYGVWADSRPDVDS